MSLADKTFKNMCNDIIAHGTNTKGQKVRPVWEDTGEKAYTIKQFGVCNRYDLRKEFPALTLRKTAIKLATNEVLWIYQNKSNNTNDLKSHIWDQWADKDGSIGKAYGYQVGSFYRHHRIQDGAILNDPALNDKYPSSSVLLASDDRIFVTMDQMDAVLYDLQSQPYSRRIMTNLWNVEQLADMNLQPCVYSCTFNVTDEGGDKPVLNLLINQRSQDILAANNWNVCQYAVLLMMVSQVSNMIPGQLVHMIADAHIYDRHIPAVKELIGRKEYPAPIVTLDPDIKNFYDFTEDSLTILNYIAGEQITNIPIAK